MGQRAKTVNSVSGDVVGEAGRRGAATKGPALSSLGDLGGPGEGGAPQGEHMGELRPGHLVSTLLGALHPSTYLARGLPMATPPPDQTQDTPR